MISGHIALLNTGSSAMRYSARTALQCLKEDCSDLLPLFYCYEPSILF